MTRPLPVAAWISIIRILRPIVREPTWDRFPFPGRMRDSVAFSPLAKIMVRFRRAVVGGARPRRIELFESLLILCQKRKPAAKAAGIFFGMCGLNECR